MANQALIQMDCKLNLLITSGVQDKLLLGSHDPKELNLLLGSSFMIKVYKNSIGAHEYGYQ